MPIDIPLLNQPIGETGFIFTPDNFPTWLAYVAPQLEAIESGGGFDGLVSGYGRIAGADYFGADSTAPQAPATPALAIELSAGVWHVQGQQIEVEDGATLPVPANMTAPGRYGYVSAAPVEDSSGAFELEIEATNWFTTLQPQLSAAGLACIGRVVSDTDSVLSIDKISADVIVPGAVIRDLLENIVAGAGNGGGSIVLFGTTIAISPDDVTPIRAYVDAKDAAQRAEYLALIQSGGGEAIPQPYDLLADEIAINRFGLAGVTPGIVLMGQIATVGVGFGAGQTSETPNFTPSTGAVNELAFSASDGTFGPPSGG